MSKFKYKILKDYKLSFSYFKDDSEMINRLLNAYKFLA